MTLTKSLYLSAALGLLTTVASAQTLYFPLDEAPLTEQTSGRTFAVEGVRTLPFMPGVSGQALRLDGYSNYVKATGLDFSALGQTALTVSVWCAAETYPMMNAAEAEVTPSFATLVGNIDDAVKSGFAIQLSSQGGLQFKCYLKSWVLTCAAKDVVLPKYRWNHIAATIDKENNQIRLYLNGEQVGTAKCPYELTWGTAPLLIGKSAEALLSGLFHLNTFNGLIDEFRIENGIRTAGEILATYQNGIAAAGTPDLTVPASAWEDDLMRPRFHGMPSHGWTNETHGLTYADGLYHLFFQKNGNGPYMARLHWGHLVSRDLLTWIEVPTAIAPVEAYDLKGCWSGCVFADGQLTGGQPHILYTAVDNAKATICEAAPTDATLMQWTKNAANPLINGRPAGLSDDFRDPYFFRTADGAYIIVGSNKGGVGTCTLHRYNAATGTWSNNGDLFLTGTAATTCGTFWEMPNVTRMGDKWLFTATPQNTSVGVRTIYFTGDIDGQGHFVPDSQVPQTVELQGFARDGYGLLSPTICQTADGKTIALGIVPDKLPSEANYQLGWAHTYSLPREWSLAADGTLVQKPFSGLRALRSGDGSRAEGRQVETLMEFTVGEGRVGVELLKHGDKSARIFYNPADNTLSVDLTALDRTRNDGGVFDGLYTSALPRTIARGETLTLHCFLDGSVLDIFVGGQWATSLRVFCTDAEARGVAFFNEGTNVVVDQKAWTLDAEGTDAILAPATERDRATVADGSAVGTYTLSGQPAPQPRKGAYIINGKKVILR